MEKRFIKGGEEIWESKKTDQGVKKTIKCKRGNGKRTSLRCKKRHLLEGGGWESKKTRLGVKNVNVKEGREKEKIKM